MTQYSQEPIHCSLVGSKIPMIFLLATDEHICLMCCLCMPSHCHNSAFHPGGGSGGHRCAGGVQDIRGAVQTRGVGGDAGAVLCRACGTPTPFGPRFPESDRILRLNWWISGCSNQQGSLMKLIFWGGRCCSQWPYYPVATSVVEGTFSAMKGVLSFDRRPCHLTPITPRLLLLCDGRC